MEFSGLVSPGWLSRRLFPETVADHRVGTSARPKEPAQVAGFFVSMDWKLQQDDGEGNKVRF